MTDQSGVLLHEQDGGVSILTLNRPDALNALNAKLRHELLAGIIPENLPESFDVRPVGEEALEGGRPTA